ncbi:MAG: 2-C-methyl-D-erythritol 4-phosphate cytidylyltransferase [Alicyclobacillaceae bacterium]|nr:2-C-methyl-D-erythritol 4-phosphate cytidylyltransferase [Alicyclobacillaceae bacterium]
MDITAVIVAAGRGTRMGTAVKKQFLALGDKPVLIHAAQRLAAAPEVDRLVVVAAPEDVDLTRRLLEEHSITKVHRVTTGGPDRQDSVYRGLMAACDSRWILVHDGARPLVRPSDISRLVPAAEKSGAALLAVPVRETVKRVIDGRVEETVPREDLWLAQTPQLFRTDLLLLAHDRARAEGWYGTDDASLLERIGITVSVVPGSPSNLKITTPEDLALAEALLRLGL